MIYIPKESVNTVHLDRLLHNNECFHHPICKRKIQDLNEYLPLALSLSYFAS